MRVKRKYAQQAAKMGITRKWPEQNADIIAVAEEKTVNF